MADAPPKDLDLDQMLTVAHVEAEWDHKMENGIQPWAKFAAYPVARRENIIEFANAIADLAAKRALAQATARAEASRAEAVPFDIREWEFPLDGLDDDAQLIVQSFATDHMASAKVVNRKTRQFVTLTDIREAFAKYAPKPAPPSVTLSDGKVFTVGKWDNKADTFDIVTNYQDAGRESRKCYKSIEQLRENHAASWADWQAIDRALLALQEAK